MWYMYYVVQTFNGKMFEHNNTSVSVNTRTEKNSVNC